MSAAIRVVSLINRFGFDGQTGVLVLKGTPGHVGELTLHPPAGMSALANIPSMRPTLTVYWDTAVIQDKSNDEPAVISDWEETDVDPADVNYLSHTTFEVSV